MSRSQKVFSFAWLALVAVSLWGRGLPQFADSDPLGLPDDLQQWTHATTVAAHEIYANPISLKASKNRGVYPDGAKLVLTANSTHVPGKTIGYGVMLKDDQLFFKTGGWGFAGFAADGTRQPLSADKDCWSCHSQKAATDYVFSASLQ